MDKTSSKERILHIQNAIVLIQSFIANQSEMDFSNDIKGQNAVMYQFLIIGEAIRHVDNSILEKYDYPWHIPKSFRNFIAHEYHKINVESVYRAANDLSKLLQVIEKIKKEF